MLQSIDMIGSEYFMSLAVPITVAMAISFVARMVHLILFERYFKLTFKDAPVWSFFYFSAWTGVVLTLFPEEVHSLFSALNAFAYFVLVFFMIVVFPFVYHELRTYIGDPKWLEKLYPDQGMLSLEERYILAKVADVIFQQCIIGTMIVILSSGGLDYQHVVAIVAPLFILAHVYIFFAAGFIWGLHYTAYAALGGFAFPYLIVYVPYGIVFSIILHMFFYVLSAAYFAKFPHPSGRHSSAIAH